MRALWITAAAACWISTGSAQTLDPLVADPQHYHLEIENQWVRVIREKMAPNQKMPMHQHPAPGAVIVFLTGRHNRLVAPDGTAQELTNKPGDLMWSNPSTHRSENLNNAPFEALQIEPRRPSGVKITPAPAEKQDATIIDPKHYHVEVDNEYVRVIRVKIGPHEKLAMHRHPDTNAILVHLTDQNMKLTRADGTVNNTKYPARHVRWVESAGLHQDENLSDQPLEFLRIELKLSR
jgi:quercetin dioxygenase-like cupin family protein